MSCCCAGFQPASTTGGKDTCDDDQPPPTDDAVARSPPRIYDAPKPQEPFTPLQQTRTHNFVLTADGEHQRVTGISNSVTKYAVDKPIRVHTTPQEERIERLMKEEAELTSVIGNRRRELRF